MDQSIDGIEQIKVRRVKSSAWWWSHFRRNRHRDWNIPWQIKQPLSPTLSQRIAASIAEFQRGESSEARIYLAKSERFSSRTGDAAFQGTSILFVQEENGHASLLLRFMQLAGIPPSTRSFGDRVFRLLRALGDIGWASRVLIIAELIAQEYYPCLQAATDHPALKRICDKIVADEESHICFQIERIVRVEASLGFWQIALCDLLQTGLMAGAAFLDGLSRPSSGTGIAPELRGISVAGVIAQSECDSRNATPAPRCRAKGIRLRTTDESLKTKVI